MSDRIQKMYDCMKVRDKIGVMGSAAKVNHSAHTQHHSLDTLWFCYITGEGTVITALALNVGAGE